VSVLHRPVLYNLYKTDWCIKNNNFYHMPMPKTWMLHMILLQQWFNWLTCLSSYYWYSNSLRNFTNIPIWRFLCFLQTRFQCFLNEIQKPISSFCFNVLLKLQDTGFLFSPFSTIGSKIEPFFSKIFFWFVLDDLSSIPPFPL